MILICMTAMGQGAVYLLQKDCENVRQIQSPSSVRASSSGVHHRCRPPLLHALAGWRGKHLVTLRGARLLNRHRRHRIRSSSGGHRGLLGRRRSHQPRPRPHRGGPGALVRQPLENQDGRGQHLGGEEHEAGDDTHRQRSLHVQVLVQRPEEQPQGDEKQQRDGVAQQPHDFVEAGDDQRADHPQRRRRLTPPAHRLTRRQRLAHGVGSVGLELAPH
mmetsp:Transcript_23776/g.58288  ORF Transcript_23776/g.58288 Transcript_23776/m.58288 type:complete len:217 (+) Transcript_23776:219-869(+)